MTAVDRDPAGPAAGVEWRADRHDFHLPEIPTPVQAPEAARMLAHRLAVTPVSPQNVDEVLAAAKACLLEAGMAYQQARTERAAIEDTARELAGQRPWSRRPPRSSRRCAPGSSATRPRSTTPGPAPPTR